MCDLLIPEGMAGKPAREVRASSMEQNVWKAEKLGADFGSERSTGFISVSSNHKKLC